MKRSAPPSLMVLAFGAGELAWLLFRFGLPLPKIAIGLALWAGLWHLRLYRLPVEHPILARAVMYTLPVGCGLWALGWVASGFAPLSMSPWVLGWLSGVLGLALAILVGSGAES